MYMFTCICTYTCTCICTCMYMYYVSVHVHVCYLVAKMQGHIWGSDNTTMQFVNYYSVGVYMSDPELE